jgi:WD40 repeat protein
MESMILCPACRETLQAVSSPPRLLLRCPGCRKTFHQGDQAVLAPVATGGDPRGLLTTCQLLFPQAAQGLDTPRVAVATEDAGVPPEPSPLEVVNQAIYQLADEPKAATPSPQTPPSLGQVGRFQLRAFLGQGGFGTVYQGFDPVLERLVALKVPKFAADAAEQVERFLVEARASARLRHPNIVAIFDSGRADDTVYIAAEFIDGMPLSVRLREDSPNFRLAARWIRDLGLALAYAHGEGIIHRDIKPANIMIDVRNRPLLMDFGLARPLDSGLESKGQVLLAGTPAYMSPEQASGATEEVGPASDQYALGVVLYELLARRRPFEGPAATVLEQVRKSPPPPPRQYNGKVPKDLQAICLRALAKRPNRRYPDVAEMAADLHRWLNDEPVRARDSSRLERARLWLRRHRTWAAAVALAAVGVVLAATAWSTVAAYRLQVAAAFREKEREVEDAQQQVLVELRKHQTAMTIAEAKHRNDMAVVAGELRAKRRLECAELRRQGTVLCYQGKIDQGILVFAQALQVALKADEQVSEQVRGELADWQQRMFHLRFWLPKDRELAGFSPDGRFAITLNDESGGQGEFYRKALRHYDLESATEAGSPVSHNNGSSDNRNFTGALSHDGRLFLTRGAETADYMTLWELDSPNRIIKTLKHADPPIQGYFTPDGKQVLTRSTRTLYFWNAETGAALGDPQVVDEPLIEVVINPNSGTYLTHTQTKDETATRSTYQLWDFVKHERRGAPVKVAEHSGTREPAVFSADGKVLALHTAPATVQLFDGVRGTSYGLPLEHSQPVRRMAFVPGSTLIVTHSANRYSDWRRPPRSNAAPEIAVWNYNPECLVSQPSDLLNLFIGKATWPVRRQSYAGLHALSPDGRLLLTADKANTLQLWNVLTGLPAGAPLRQGVSELNALFSPNGKLIVLSDRNQAQVYETQGGARRGQLFFHNSDGSARFSPDSRMLAFRLDDGSTQLWELQPRLAILLQRPSRGWDPDWSPPATFAFGKNGQNIRAWQRSSGTATVRRWDSATGKSLSENELKSRGYNSHTLAVSPDGALQLIHSLDSIKVCRANGMAISQGLKCRGHVGAAAFSPDGNQVAVADAEQVYLGKVSLEKRGMRTLERGGIDAVSFSSDGRLLATGETTTGLVRVWSVETGKVNAEFHLNEIGELVFSPTSRFLLSGKPGEHVIWDLANGRPFSMGIVPEADVSPRQAPFAWVSFAPDDHVVLIGTKPPGSAYRDGGDAVPGRVLRLWDTTTGQAIGEPLGPRLITRSSSSSPHLAIAFHPNSRLLLVAHGDSAQLWDTATAKPVGFPLKLPGSARTALFSPQGDQVLIAGSNNAATLWPVPLCFPADGEGFRVMTEVLSGQELSSEGKFKSLTAASWLERRQSRDH